MNEDHDGVVAKRLDLPYRSGARGGVRKIKLLRSADCVVGGFATARRSSPTAKSSAHCCSDSTTRAAFCTISGLPPPSDRRIDALSPTGWEKIVTPQSFTGKTPGGPSRWSTTKRSGQWKAVRATYVVEVSYDHVSSDRLRHGTKIVRWRPDKNPCQCRMDQLRQKLAKLPLKAAE